MTKGPCWRRDLSLWLLFFSVYTTCALSETEQEGLTEMSGTKKRGEPPKRGRPKKNPAEVKSKTIPLRVTPETHERLHEAAASKGLGLTEWLVGLGLRAADRLNRRK